VACRASHDRRSRQRIDVLRADALRLPAISAYCLISRSEWNEWNEEEGENALPADQPVNLCRAARRAQERLSTCVHDTRSKAKEDNHVSPFGSVAVRLLSIASWYLKGDATLTEELVACYDCAVVSAARSRSTPLYEVIYVVASKLLRRRGEPMGLQASIGGSLCEPFCLVGGNGTVPVIENQL